MTELIQAIIFFAENWLIETAFIVSAYFVKKYLDKITAERRLEMETAERSKKTFQNLLGARIDQSCRYYLKRGSITREEFIFLENMLEDYHYWDGNGGMAELVGEVRRLLTQKGG